MRITYFLFPWLILLLLCCSNSNNYESNPTNSPVIRRGKVVLSNSQQISEQLKFQNTIYEVLYDFDLKEQTLVIPCGSVLKFEGGILRNGRVKGIFTVDGTPQFENVRFDGVLNNGVINLGWFHEADYGDLLQNMFDNMGSYSVNCEIIVPSGIFNIGEVFVKRHQQHGNNHACSNIIRGTGDGSILSIVGNGIHISGKTLIENLSIRNSTDSYAIKIGIDKGEQKCESGITLRRVIFMGNSYGCITSGDYNIHLTLSECTFKYNYG